MKSAAIGRVSGASESVRRVIAGSEGRDSAGWRTRQPYAATCQSHRNFAVPRVGDEPGERDGRPEREKAAIVTGASRGIGRATAVTLARAGADVTVNYYTHGDEAEEVVEQIRESGRSGLAFQADVSDRQAVEAMVDATVGQFGKLDIVVSNAYYSKREPFLDLSREAMRRTLDVTLWGAFHVAQAGARRMVAQGTGGSICFISSVLAFIPVATSLPYNAAV